MASYVRNIWTKNYKNLIILLQVSISNVTDGFWRFLFISTLISCVLIFPGSAYVERGGNLNNRLVASCV